MRTTPPSLNELRQQREAALARLSPEKLAAVGATLGSIAAVASAEVVGHRQERDLDMIKSPEVREAFTASFDRTVQLYDRINLDTPSPEAFAEAGVDFARLSDAYERMEEEGLAPVVVISPLLGKQQTIQLFDQLTNDQTIPNNPLKHRPDGNGLWINDTLTDTLWDEANHFPDTATVLTDASGTQWAISLSPGTPASQDQGTAHQDLTYRDQLPPLSTYLTQQATTIQAGETPIDDYSTKASITWLKTAAGALRAPRGFWSSGDGQVYVGWSGVDVRGDYLGGRLPVW